MKMNTIEEALQYLFGNDLCNIYVKDEYLFNDVTTYIWINTLKSQVVISMYKTNDKDCQVVGRVIEKISYHNGYNKEDMANKIAKHYNDTLEYSFEYSRYLGHRRIIEVY